MSEASIDGLHVEVRGEGPPILLVHGWPFDHRIFAPQIEGFSAEFQVIAWDRRGFGQSAGEPSLDADVRDMAGILAGLGLRSAHVLGMSQGGRIALRFAASRPELVRSLLLQAPAVDGFVPAAGPEGIPLARYAAWARQGDVERVRQAWLRHPMVTSGIESEETLGFLRRLLADYRGRDLAGAARDDPDSSGDVTARVAAAGIPVLILTGALETRARRQHAKFLLGAVPGAREVVLEHSGHLSNLTEPDAYNRLAIEFWKRAERDRRASMSGAQD